MKIRFQDQAPALTIYKVRLLLASVLPTPSWMFLPPYSGCATIKNEISSLIALIASQNWPNLLPLLRTLRCNISWQTENHVEFHRGDYSKILSFLLGSNDDRELGLVFIDHSGDLPNFDTINEISQSRHKMEILLYFSARNIKRLRHLKHKSLLDYMQQISKKNWLIRKPAKWDNLEWTFLLGSNTNIFGNYKKIDFFRLEFPGETVFPRRTPFNQVIHLSRRMGRIRGSLLS